MQRIRLQLVLAALLVGASGDPTGTEVVVAFSRLGFDPATIEVRLGTRVTFHNTDPTGGVYTIVASDGSFESERLAMHGEWSYRPSSRGEHEYHLKEHPEIKGTAVVQ